MDGIIVIYKPKQYTSHDVVAKVKKILEEKVGHTGTLDPNATGVLPLLIGKGTLLSKYLINHDKTYIATIQLGKRTDTLDEEGIVIEEKEVLKQSLEKENIEKVLKTFLGEQEQTPPMYSAIKVKGKKLYEYARKGQTVEIPTRKITIYEIKLITIQEELKQIVIEVSCSKGTYIRSLCDDIAKKLNTIGYMKELERTKVGQFKLEDTITIEELEKAKENIQLLKNNMISVEDFFQNKSEITLEPQKLEMFLNGVKLDTNQKDQVYRIYDQKKCFMGSGIVENKKLKRDIIL